MPRARAWRSRHPRFASPFSTTAFGALTLALVTTLTGCTSVQSTVDAAIGQGIAAIGTAQLAVDQQIDDRTFSTVTVTALGDARRELVDASNTVAQTDATTDDEAALRTDTLEALALGVDAVNDARDAMAGVGSLEASEASLDAAAHALDALQTEASANGSGL